MSNMKRSIVLENIGNTSNALKKFQDDCIFALFSLHDFPYTIIYSIELLQDRIGIRSWKRSFNILIDKLNIDKELCDLKINVRYFDRVIIIKCTIFWSNKLSMHVFSKKVNLRILKDRSK